MVDAELISVRYNSLVSWACEMFYLSGKERWRKKEIRPRRGEVWTCNFGENVGSELNKIRPCIIVQNDIGNVKAPTTIVIPISSREHRQPTQVQLDDYAFIVRESELSGTSLAEQIKVVSKARLGRKVGELSKESMDRIDDSLKISLGLHG